MRVLQDIIVHSTNYLIVHSSQQQEYLQQVYPKLRDRFKFVLLPRNHTVKESCFVEPEEEENFVLVPGDERDFEIIFRIASRLHEIHTPIQIVTRSANRGEIAALRKRYACENVSVHFDIPKSRYVSMLKKARMVVIPSHHSGRSNGQLVLLDAYALGKAVICLHGPNISDYYSAESVLTYKEGDGGDLLKKITLLCSNPGALTTLKKSAYMYLDRFRDKEEFVKEIFAYTHLK
jgi:glycosyltransferase involved in cell wall biosynthesis